MTFTIINHVAAQSTDTNTIESAAIDTTGADMIFFACYEYNPTFPSTLSDNKSNSYINLFTQTDPAGVGVVRFYNSVPPVTVGSGHKFTSTVIGGFPAIAILAVSGAKQSLYEDQTSAVGYTATTTPQPGSITETADNDLVMTAIGFSVPGTTATIDSGFTISDQLTNIAGTAFGISLAYLIETTATTRNPTWTLSTANTLALGITSIFVSTGQRFLLTPF